MGDMLFPAPTAHENYIKESVILSSKTRMGKSLTERLKTAVNIARSRSPSPEPGPSNPQTVSTTWSLDTDTPFKDFLLSYLTGSTQQKLFAFTFADQIHRDRNALVIDLEDVYFWLGHTRRDQAVRTLKAEFGESDYLFIPGGVHNSVDLRDQRDRYLISVTTFKKLLLSSRSQQGKEYRDLIVTIEGAAYDYMKIEMDRARRLIETHEARSADLTKQIEDLRLSRVTFWLYAYRLFENRYKCGFTTDIEARTKQHRTSCPSVYLIHKVTVHSKALEKVMDSVLKAHGRHVTQEEYVFEGGDEQVTLVLNTIADFERVLHITPFEKFEDLQQSTRAFLEGAQTPAGPLVVPSTAASIDRLSELTSNESNPYAYFVEIAVEVNGRENDFLTVKEAVRVWKLLKKHQRHKDVLKNTPTMSNVHTELIRLVPNARYYVNAVVKHHGNRSLERMVFRGCRLRFSVVHSNLEPTDVGNPDIPTFVEEPIDSWLSNSMERTFNNDDRVGARQAYDMFKESTGLNMTENDFNAGMKFCGVPETPQVFGRQYMGLRAI